MTTDQDEIRVLAPTGVTGSGFLESSFEQGLAQKPHFIGADAGSTDPGPEFLGSGATAFPLAAIRRDLRLMMIGAALSRAAMSAPVDVTQKGYSSEGLTGA